MLVFYKDYPDYHIITLKLPYNHLELPYTDYFKYTNSSHTSLEKLRKHRITKHSLLVALSTLMKP